MKAVRIEGPGRVTTVELPTPEPGPGEVAIRVDAAAICATDRRLSKQGTPAPRIPGHEVAGVLGDGTAVGVQPNVGCGRCASCALGLENRCPDHVDIGIQRDGGLAEWIVVPEGHVVPLDGFPLELAPSIEPLACCLHAVGMLDVADGDLAVVVGAGTLGIIGMLALQAAGARVAVVQRSEARRRLAAELGADAVLEPGDDVAAALGALPAAALVTAPGIEALSWAIDHVDVGAGSTRSQARPAARLSTPTPCTTATSGWWGARAPRSRTTAARATSRVREPSRSTGCRRGRWRSTRCRGSCSTAIQIPGCCGSWSDRRVTPAMIHRTGWRRG